MKFGANTFMWTSPFRTENLPLLKKVKEMGFDSIEIPPEDVSLIDLKKLKTELKATGLACSILCASGPSRDISSDDPSVQKAGTEFIQTCIRVAAELGSTMMAGPLYAAVGNLRSCSDEDRKKQWDRSVKTLKRVADFAKQYGIVLALEPINRFETDMVNTAEYAVRMVEDINHPQVKVQLDTFHMNIEEKNIGQAIRKAGKYLAHFHACENDRGTPGTGHIPWQEVKEALQAVGYNGYAVIESFTPETKEIAKAACIWRPLASSQDSMAQEGLRFLKNLFK
jgi:D-psicose/D-tagatose/L-ribulose 3-epimerase